MKQDGKQHADADALQGDRGQGRRPAPGKVTLTSKLGPGSTPVQRQAAGTARGAPRAARDPDMDAWMDAAHRGAAAEPAAVQRRQDATSASAGTATTAAASKVQLTIEWRGQFGADLSARLRVRGHTGKADWVTLVKDVEVTDADGTGGVAADKLSHTIEVERHDEYEVTFSPVADAPDDRYRSTSAKVRVGASAAAATVTKRLDVNRWNRKNVDDVWKGQNIDPDKADDVVAASLFGRSVNVHKAVVARVAQTNAKYEALIGQHPEKKAEIAESLFVTGGYAVRTTSDGVYSNHSVGYAIDVNAHESTKQNHHFQKEADMSLLEDLVQPVVKTDPAFANFLIKDDKGQRQLQASHVFNVRFPAYLANLLDLGKDAQDLDQYLYAEKNMHADYAAYFRDLREKKAQELMDSIDGKMLSKAIKAQKDPQKKTQLQLIQSNWQSLRAWLFGVTVRDKQEDKDKRIVGMIPLREDVLQMFLDTGWKWGGDWKGEKDYMHFEDPDALKHVAQTKGKTP